jgi:hypothetical protein
MSSPKPIAHALWFERNRHTLLTGILAMCLALRVWLASTGGQGYWPDEMRYSSAARESAWQFVHGTSRDAWLQLIGQADHLLFKIAGLPVAFLELKCGQSGPLAASWFGLFSVLAIWMVYAIARAAGASAREGLLATFFAAGANSLFYYCRHFFPYDLSLFLCLLALWIALKPQSWLRSILVGLAAGLGFLSYNGYWVLGGAVLVFHVLSKEKGRSTLSRAVLSGLGLLAPIVTVILAAKLLNRDLIASFLAFSRTITQGNFGNGWSLIGEYLYSSEGVVLISWLLLISAGLKFGSNNQRIKLWLGFIAGLYLTLVFCSDLMRTFVVYGRIARILVPFLCLGAAAGMESLICRWKNSLGWTAILSLMAVASATHISIALRQVFPDDFLRVAKIQAQIKRLNTPSLFRLLNVDRLWEGYVMNEPRPHTSLLQRTHPLQFAPFLYEGCSKEFRTRFKKEDISMQLITVPAVKLPDIGGGYTGPLKIRLKFPENKPGISEPLLTSGDAQKANFIYARYIDETHIQFGYDRWGSGGPMSDPVNIDFKENHELILISSAQISKHFDSPQNLDPKAWADLQRSINLILDGKIIFSEQVGSHSIKPESVMIGMNLVGGSSARESFSGEIHSIEILSWEEVQKQLNLGLSLKYINKAVAAASPGPAWNGYCGPLRLDVRFPLGQADLAEPLIVTGATGKGDFIYVRYLEDSRVRFGYDHWGIGGIESEPILIDKSRRAEVVINAGALMPPVTSPLYANSASLKTLRERVILYVNGKAVLNTKMESHPTSPSTIVIGQNSIGGSTTAELFSGEITAITSKPTAEVLQMINNGTK